METKSPTTSVKSREIIGVDQFSQRREVFDKYDTVFMPIATSPGMVPPYDEVEPIVTSNHGKTTSNFKRNTPGYSSMRESRTEDRNIEFRPRKYSDNFTSDLNQKDDVDYRYSMTERTRRLSKLRREFLNSNLHEPGTDTPFIRTGTRASLPAGSASVMKYKIESPNLYKFPFAEPYATPPPVRRVVVDLGPVDVSSEKENQDPRTKHQSLPNNESSSKIDRQKLFEELIKRYSPQRKPVNWNLPPTRPRVVGSVPKSTSSAADTIDNISKVQLEENLNKSGDDDDVFVKDNKESNANEKPEYSENSVNKLNHADLKLEPKVEIIENGLEITHGEPKNERDSKTSLTELEEKNDRVPELSTMQRLTKEAVRKPSLEKYTDLTIPALINKMTEEAEDFDTHKKPTKKVKRKRSFLDKLLGRKKEK